MTSHLQLRITLVAALVLGVGASAAACTSAPSSPDTAFKTYGSGVSTTAQVSQPSLFILSSSGDADQIIGWLDEQTASALSSVDYDKEYVLAAFLFYGSSGYSVAVKRVDLTASGGSVVVDVKQPGPEEQVNTVETFPYAVVGIPRENVPAASGYAWRLVDTGGSVLATTNAP